MGARKRRSSTSCRLARSPHCRRLRRQPPTDWTVPEPTAMYARASIVEQLPDPLSPLFAEMIDRSVTRSLQSLFREFLDEDVIKDSDVGLPTVNGYAYYRYSRSGMGRLMWKSPRAFRMLFTARNHD